MSEGFVYVLTNEFMPGIVKIGYTNRSPEKRAWELYEKRTGVPGRFRVAYRFKCNDAKSLERKVHNALISNRVNAYREYFNVDVDRAKQVIESLGGSHLPTAEEEPSRPAPKTPEPTPASKIAPNSEPTPPRPLHRVREDYERACEKADSQSRIAAASIVVVFSMPLTTFINNKIDETGVWEASIFTTIACLLVTYSLLRRLIGYHKRSNLEEEYRQRIEK